MTAIDSPAQNSGAAAPVVQVDALDFGYPGQAALFTDFSLRLPRGLTLVRGSEGTGKTTLLRLLAGELDAQAGHLQIGGIRLADRPQAYRQQVFWRDPRADDHGQMVVQTYFASLAARFPALDPQALDTLVTALALTEHLHKTTAMLSTGTKRKVWLAGALASGAPLTLLDDPFAALDTASIACVKKMLEQLSDPALPARAYVVTGYEVPGALPLRGIVEL